MTRTDRRQRIDVAVEPPEGGLVSRSFVLCDQLLALAVDRFGPRLGVVTPQTLAEVARRLRILLEV